MADYGWGLVVLEQAPGPIASQVRMQGTTTNIGGATVRSYLGGVLEGTATMSAKLNLQPQPQ